jgi:BirA family biotin operon repressor/biotin-[acetyl-CoA-carboxylase] ligase
MTERLADGVLEALLRAGGGAVSGQRLADALGVTRAAVWKGVSALRDMGYAVESLPGRGYRLAEGRGEPTPGEVGARLATRRMGRVLRHLPQTDSTNREAARWAEEGAPEGALVVADFQTAGRGRLGRSWHGRPGESLLLSLVLRPRVPAARAPLVTFVAASALADAVSGWVDPGRIEIKWPNDVLIDGRKTAGILLEGRTEGGGVGYVVLGVGVNVTGDTAGMPEEIRGTAAVLASAARRAPDRLELLCRFLEALEELYDRFVSEGFEAVRPRWDRWFRMAGREVRVSGGGRMREGRVLGLADDGALELATAAGGIERIHAGDIEWSTTKGREG